MKFIHYLEGIAGVGIFPLISLLIFFFFFLGVTIWVLKADKASMEEMENLPLQPDKSNDRI
ncbi:MAG: CcoQ/FixQ family Cbb3-type cytochrome c oxidase assembly chaperone [Bacteroidia bacterium]